MRNQIILPDDCLTIVIEHHDHYRNVKILLWCTLCSYESLLEAMKRSAIQKDSGRMESMTGTFVLSQACSELICLWISTCHHSISISIFFHLTWAPSILAVYACGSNNIWATAARCECSDFTKWRWMFQPWRLIGYDGVIAHEPG